MYNHPMEEKRVRDVIPEEWQRRKVDRLVDVILISDLARRNIAVYSPLRSLEGVEAICPGGISVDPDSYRDRRLA